MKRSRFLTHWTGRDIGTRRAELNEHSRRLYMERLFSLLDSGFWMTIPEERLTGLRNGDRPTSLSYSAPMTCFTELRLSAAQAHHLRYGLLGLVVDRSFVLERWGAPVHYVRSHEEDAIVGNLVMLLSWMQQ